MVFHAHPDDEAIATGGTMARAAAEGHRVVLVVATRGEQGEVPEGMLATGESLAERRVAETGAAAEVLGVARVAFLGYEDSGMAGEATNDAPGSFWQADVDEAADRLAAILVEERARVLTAYDANGVYGHPDHIQVHRVGVRAAARAGVERLYLATVDRDHVRGAMAAAVASGRALPGDLDGGLVEHLGVPGAEVTTAVDVRPWLVQKRAAMAAHASQISEGSYFLALDGDLFAGAFGTEWYLRHGAPPPAPGFEVETDLLAGLSPEGPG